MPTFKRAACMWYKLNYEAQLNIWVPTIYTPVYPLKYKTALQITSENSYSIQVVITDW